MIRNGIIALVLIFAACGGLVLLRNTVEEPHDSSCDRAANYVRDMRRAQVADRVNQEEVAQWTAEYVRENEPPTIIGPALEALTDVMAAMFDPDVLYDELAPANDRLDAEVQTLTQFCDIDHELFTLINP